MAFCISILDAPLVCVSVSVNYSGGYSCFYQGRLYCWHLLRRFLQSSTSSRCSFHLCLSSRVIRWTGPTIIPQKRQSSIYKDDLPWDSGGHWADALWSSRGPLVRPSNRIIAVDTIFLSFTRRQLQSLLGKLSFVTACVRSGQIFVSRLLNCLRICLPHGHIFRLPVICYLTSTGGWPFYYTSTAPLWLHYTRVTSRTCYLPALFDSFGSYKLVTI